ncbi:hypothetical protein KI387_011601 [Taxus chinensis]|uniref:Uncharacterized protein n=2 Tax=Taxus chinensis TaxID=29808 RepID=A0AA38CP61_TAXCH|nr:hypothetical protein KI387_011601 [Taxus chinensis]
MGCSADLGDILYPCGVCPCSDVHRGSAVGLQVLSDSGLGETFKVATSLEAEFMWETTKRRDGVRLGFGGRNGGETGVSKSRHADVSGHGIGARSEDGSSRGKQSTSPACDAVYQDGELAVLPAGILGAVDLGDRGQQVGVSRGSHPGRTQRRTSPVGARVAVVFGEWSSGAVVWAAVKGVGKVHLCIVADAVGEWVVDEEWRKA